MKHRSWFLRFVFAAALALAAAHIAHADPTTIAMRKCSFYACDNAMSLKNEARMAGASSHAWRCSPPRRPDHRHGR